MKNQKIILFILTLVFIGVTAGLCAYMKTNRRLGNPGVKIVSRPSLDTDGKIVREQSVDLPEKVSGFDSKPVGITPIELQTLPADTLFGRRLYQSADNFFVTTSVVVMGQDSRSIHKPEICLPAQGWQINEQPMTIRMEKPVPYDLPVVKVIGSKTITTPQGSSETVKTVFVYWFVAEDDITADHVARMWRMGAEMLKTGTLQRWSYIAFIANCYSGQEDATYERIKNFIIAAVPEFQIADGKPLQAVSQTNLQTAFK